MAQIRQNNVAFMNEIRKLREENDFLKNGGVTRNEETSEVIMEEKGAAIEEQVAALTPVKRKPENASIKSVVKKPKAVATPQERQEEFANTMEAKMEQIERKLQTKLEQQEVRFEANIEAKIEELGKTILQQKVQQMKADFDAKLAIWGSQSSGGGPVKTSFKPYARTSVPTEELESL